MDHVYANQTRQEAIDTAVVRFAEAQHGVFTRAQLVEAGATPAMTHRRVSGGRWERVWPGVYRLPGVPRTWRQTLLAAVFAWGPDAVASHRAAAALRGLPHFPPGVIELTVRRGLRRSADAIVHTGALAREECELVAGIPATTVDRTLIDLASVAPADIVEEALDDALRRGLVGAARLRWKLSATNLRGRPGVVALRAMLVAREPAQTPQSVFETRMLRAIRKSGLPMPVLQHPVRDPSGRVLAVVDFAYPDARLAIEADSRRWHSGRRAFEHDRRRLNALTLHGWRVLRFTWTQLTRHEHDVTAAIANTLERR